MSLESCETVEIQTEPSVDNPTGVVIINKSDLTPEHVLVGAEPTAPVAPVAPVDNNTGAETSGAPKAPWDK